MALKKAYFRPTWIEINLENVAYNVKNMKERLPAHCELTAVVKADAYGHGAVAIAKKALESGADRLAVALLEEAIELRTHGITAPIIVLSRMNPAYVNLAVQYNLTVTVFQKEWLLDAENSLKEGKMRIHLELDTGMGRTGIREREELVEILDIILQSNRIYLTGVYTHFATADEEDASYMQEQESRYKAMLEIIETKYPEKFERHAANSAATIRTNDYLFDSVRYGISLYGIYPSKYIQQQTRLKIKQVFSLQSELISVKLVKANETISYGATYKTTQDEWIGTVPIGYGDGWIRKLQGQSVLIAGKRMPIVGRICMDQLMVRLDQPYEIGEQVTLIGKQGDEEITMEEIARKLETIPYEIPCMIGKRVPRIYI